jgi:hypothetical protein
MKNEERRMKNEEIKMQRERSLFFTGILRSSFFVLHSSFILSAARFHGVRQ